ncbi:MAG: alpha-ketoglutarate-dependent dioxygenase AlkB [Myxococcales bacterium]|nr:alpha-ketoglutarate-dependent dioxygenase AlkB [Myxococcales bacterium]
MALQQSLFQPAAPAIDRAFARVERIRLDETAWVDFAPEWVSGADALFEETVASRNWKQRTRRMYDQRMLEPRLTAPWNLASGEPLPSLIEEMRVSLSRRYGIEFDSVGFNYYRDGRDSVAWHRDKIRREVVDPIVALVSIGERRRFLLRPRGGGTSRPFMLGRGDLLVTGGTAQRAWEHTVPKVAQAGPRISLAFRHGMHPLAYGD